MKFMIFFRFTIISLCFDSILGAQNDRQNDYDDYGETVTVRPTDTNPTGSTTISPTPPPPDFPPPPPPPPLPPPGDIKPWLKPRIVEDNLWNRLLNLFYDFWDGNFL